MNVFISLFTGTLPPQCRHPRRISIESHQLSIAIGGGGGGGGGGKNKRLPAVAYAQREMSCRTS